MRPVDWEERLAACGQRAGRAQGAAILSVVESCRRLGVR